MYTLHMLKLIGLALEKWIASLGCSPVFLESDRHGHFDQDHYVIFSVM